MKENKAFRILFITKKQLKSRQGSHRMFLKPQYKVYRGASILYFNASFSDVLSISISPPLSFYISLKANINIDRSLKQQLN